MATTLGGTLTLPLPEFGEDLVGRIYRDFSVNVERGPVLGEVQVAVTGEPGVDYHLESSSDLSVWSPIGSPTNAWVPGVWHLSPDGMVRYYRGTVR